MAKRRSAGLVGAIPSQEGLSWGQASFLEFPARPARPIVTPSVPAPRPAVRRQSTQNALYMAGVTFGLVVGTTLGLGVLGAFGG